MSLKVENLHIEVEGKKIVNGVSLEVKKGEVVAIMGPNGSGKSTLANTIMGHPKYTITNGKLSMNGKDITSMPVDQRARSGLFLSFQYPAEIEGVTVMNFLRTAYSARTGKKISVVDFYKLLLSKMEELKIDKVFAKRHINVGFSGGEKKRLEILQMALLEPEYAILDETDSGLDVDALRVVAEGIEKTRSDKMGILLITHYSRILKYIKPDKVIIMSAGKIVREGKAQLAQEIEEHGYKL